MRIIKLTFPCAIRLVNPREVEIELAEPLGPMLTPEACEELTAGLSDQESDELCDEIHHLAMTASLKAKIRVR
jgi:hypothetical protein